MTFTRVLDPGIRGIQCISCHKFPPTARYELGKQSNMVKEQSLYHLFCTKIEYRVYLILGNWCSAHSSNLCYIPEYKLCDISEQWSVSFWGYWSPYLASLIMLTVIIKHQVPVSLNSVALAAASFWLTVRPRMTVISRPQDKLPSTLPLLGLYYKILCAGAPKPD